MLDSNQQQRKIWRFPVLIIQLHRHGGIHRATLPDAFLLCAAQMLRQNIILKYRRRPVVFIVRKRDCEKRPAIASPLQQRQRDSHRPCQIKGTVLFCNNRIRIWHRWRVFRLRIEQGQLLEGVLFQRPPCGKRLHDLVLGRAPEAPALLLNHLTDMQSGAKCLAHPRRILFCFKAPRIASDPILCELRKRVPAPKALPDRACIGSNLRKLLVGEQILVLEGAHQTLLRGRNLRPIEGIISIHVRQAQKGLDPTVSGINSQGEVFPGHAHDRAITDFSIRQPHSEEVAVLQFVPKLFTLELKRKLK